jgi:hypothetical protein
LRNGWLVECRYQVNVNAIWVVKLAMGNRIKKSKLCGQW